MARVPRRPRAQRMARLSMVTALIATAACTSGTSDTTDGGDPSSTTSAGSSSTTEGVPDGRVSITTLPPSPDQDRERQRTDFTSKILEDGFVSDAEWESAVLALIACMDEGGVRTVDYDTDPGGWSFAYTEAVPDSGVDVESVYADCYSGYVEGVEPVFLAQTGLTPREQELVRVAIVACIRSEGIEIPDDADDMAMIEAVTQESPELYGNCRTKVLATLFP